ncbi:MAG TPA: tyrosine-type recombinase/integrase [Acidimicrobiales bacterium]|nr:tyrosine-type recombinase/integrase [Acidimicrobiales bacterium]
MAGERRAAKRFFCAGTNRFGRPCTNRVDRDGQECGRCRGVAGLPTFEAPQSAAPAALPAADDWTVASQLQARLAPLAGGNPQLERLVQVCVQLAGNSRATGSKVVYEPHWRTFVLFCQSVGLSCELPVPAETLACFVAYLAEFGRVDRETGERDGTAAPLRHGYLRQAISAVGYRHDLHGLPSPVNDPLVRGVLRGYGRLHGTDVRGKDPIRLEGLTRIATTLSTAPPMARRDRALVLLATHPGLGLNAGQLGRLDGEHVLLGATAHEPSALLVHPGGRSLHLEPIELEPDTDVRGACAVRGLLELAPDGFGPVFRSAVGQRLSRQGVMKIVRTAIASAGLAGTAVADGLPRLAEAQDRARLANHVSRPESADVRDLALILNLYWGAFRGSELVAMTWSDARIVERGVEWRVRHAKNDQLGKGEIVGAARNPNPLLCPAAALADWRSACAELLGRELRDDDPVFIRLDRQLDDLEPITRDGAAQIVKRAAVAAGLEGNYASHSLRAGFVTDALDAGATREQVQRHGRWSNIRSIDPYYRKTEVWGRNNPSQRLAGS